MKLLAIPIILAAAACALVPAGLGQSQADASPAPSAAVQPIKPIHPQTISALLSAQALGAAASAPAGNPDTTPRGSAAMSSSSPSPAARTDANGDVPSDSESTEYVYRSSVDEVNVVFTVSDRRGRFITDLNQRDFQVLDDNKAAKQIVSFSHETNLPLQVGLLIDASNSIRDRFKFEQDAAIEFLTQTIRPGRGHRAL
jgi:hypothetical protein